jgi:predicted DNA-binding WGR domain protein
MVKEVYLERREPGENIHRFYEIDIGRDLFGVWCVTRRWGRIGTTGRKLVSSFELELEALAESNRMSSEKAKRGYFYETSA